MWHIPIYDVGLAPALVARMANGPSFGLANRTEGSGYELPARWLVLTCYVAVVLARSNSTTSVTIGNISLSSRPPAAPGR